MPGCHRYVLIGVGLSRYSNKQRERKLNTQKTHKGERKTEEGMQASLKLPAVLLLLLLLCSIMAEGFAGTGDSSAAAPYIVYTERPEGEELEAFHIRTLSSVFGSEEAARKALIYSYKNAASGFAVKLTPEQALQMSKQPGVFQVVPSITYQLHSDPASCIKLELKKFEVGFLSHPIPKKNHYPLYSS